MSADNWRVCPRCKRKKIVEVEVSDAKLTKSYGKGSAEEYLAKVQKNTELRASVAKLEETLREDYELSTDEDGEFFVSYGCRCSVCDFQFSFKHEESVLTNTL